MSSIFGSDQTTTTKPYKPFRDPINSALQDYINQYTDAGVWDGDASGQINRDQLKGIRDTRNALAGFGDLADTQKMWGNKLLGNLDPAQDYLNTLLTEGGALTRDPQQYLDLTETLANNPYIDDMIGAATRDIDKYYGREVMPGIAGSANLTAGLDNSKYAQQAAMARGERDLDVFDSSAGIRYDNYGRAFDASMGAAARDDQLGVNAANQMINLGNMGMNYLTSGYNTGLQGAQGLTQLGDYGQGLEDRRLAGEREKHYRGLGDSTNYLNNLVAGGAAFPSTTTSSNPGWGNIGLQIGGAWLAGGAPGASALAGLFGGGGSGGGSGVPDRPVTAPGMPGMGPPLPNLYGPPRY